MKDTSGFDPLVDDIAHLIDTAVADPARAEEITREIRVRLALRGAGPCPTGDDASDEPEDLWDNVPL